MTKKVKRQKPESRRKGSTLVVKWIFRLFSGIAIAVIYYLVFSIFFDTPIEYELKKSTRKIEQEYDQLSHRYDVLRMVLENVVERDRSVYMILFESEPDRDQGENRNRRLAFYEQIEKQSSTELGNYFDTMLGQLYRRVSTYNEGMQEQTARAREDVSKVLHIPAIQPVDNKQLTLLTASFGERIHPFFKTMSQHKGVDYSVATGTAVFATADGIIKSVQTRGQNAGVSLLIDHGNNYETYYAHLDKIVVQPGRKVSRGDIIAFSGNTGLSFAPHLHYEVRYDRQPLDPINYFFMELDMPQMEKLKTISQMGMQSFD